MLSGDSLNMVVVMETWGMPAALGKTICPFIGKAQWQKETCFRIRNPSLFASLPDQQLLRCSQFGNPCPWRHLVLPLGLVAATKKQFSIPTPNLHWGKGAQHE